MNWKMKVPAIALGVLTLSSTSAFASGDYTAAMERHQAEMAKGMPHEDAYAAQRGRVSNDERATERARKHASAMSAGKGHEEARKLDAISSPAADDETQANARAKKHAEVMQQGKGHEEARKVSGTD